MHCGKNQTFFRRFIHQMTGYASSCISTSQRLRSICTKECKMCIKFTFGYYSQLIEAYAKVPICNTRYKLLRELDILSRASITTKSLPRPCILKNGKLFVFIESIRCVYAAKPYESSNTVIIFVFGVDQRICAS